VVDGRGFGGTLHICQAGERELKEKNLYEESNLKHTIPRIFGMIWAEVQCNN
jgi:hypothetical protein